MPLHTSCRRSISTTNCFENNKTYLNRRTLPQTNGITKVRMCASLPGVDLYEPEFVPDAVDQVCEAVNVQCRQGGRRVASAEKGKDGDGDRDCDYDYDWLALV